MTAGGPARTHITDSLAGTQAAPGASFVAENTIAARVLMIILGTYRLLYALPAGLSRGRVAGVYSSPSLGMTRGGQGKSDDSWLLPWFRRNSPAPSSSLRGASWHDHPPSPRPPARLPSAIS